MMNIVEDSAQRCRVSAESPSRQRTCVKDDEAMNIRVSFHPALAGRRFRLAGHCVAFSVGWWGSEVRVVFGL